MVVISDGILRLSRDSPQGRQIVVAIVGPGASAGILPVLSKGNYPLTAIAVTNLWYLKIPKSVWHEFSDRERCLCEGAVEELSRHLMSEYDLLAGMMAGDVEQRLAMAILHLTRLYNTTPIEPTCPIPITRQGLAQIACTTPETAIRVTSKWQKRGWLRGGHRSMQVLDESSLRAMIARLVPCH